MKALNVNLSAAMLRDLTCEELAEIFHLDTPKRFLCAEECNSNNSGGGRGPDEKTAWLLMKVGNAQ